MPCGAPQNNTVTSLERHQWRMPVGKEDEGRYGNPSCRMGIAICDASAVAISRLQTLFGRGISYLGIPPGLSSLHVAVLLVHRCPHDRCRSHYHRPERHGRSHGHTSGANCTIRLHHCCLRRPRTEVAARSIAQLHSAKEPEYTQHKFLYKLIAVLWGIWPPGRCWSYSRMEGTHGTRGFR